MYFRDGRGQSGLHDVRALSPQGRHPNWSHPDHDACGTGFIARLGGAPGYDIIQHALTALERLTHRGGVDADGASGDGAGLLTSLPQAFFRARAQEQGIALPEMFAVGFAFIPSSVLDEARAAIESAADTERLRVIGWRRVPTNTNSLGRRALETMPEIWQFFVEPFHPAHPFRYVAHNGEINTIVSNRRWLRAKAVGLRSRLTVGSWFPLLEENVSDSASFDNGFELRLLEGLSSEEAMLAMVPPAFEKDPLLSRDVRGALTALSQRSEPWDGPAALVFSDGQFVGAKLDRNGLRPLRYTLTHDGLLIAGSETGLVDLDESRIAERQRLGPGEMILANPATGLFLRWRDILKRLAIHQARNAIPQRMLTAPVATPLVPINDPKRVAGAAGWTDDQFKILFSALTRGKEADWSMGDDAPPAFLSSLPRTLWDYCKQRFAQVTNPPIDPLRETHVMSLDVHLKDGITLPSPVISAGQLSQLSAILGPEQRIDITFPAAAGVPGARCSFAQLSTTPMSGSGRPGLLLLTDRGIDKGCAPLPALLATAAVWKTMVKEGLWDVPLMVDSAQVFYTHHVALLVAVGASAVVPYLADEFAESVEPGGTEKARVAINAGLRKVLARMGVSTLASYRNSHLFEIVGLSEQLCAEAFEDAADYPGQKSLDDLLSDYLRLHK